MAEPGHGGEDRRWDPIGELRALRAELARLVGSAVGGGRGASPDVELTESDGNWVVVARLPGVAPEEVALELDDRELCIRARSEAEVNADHGLAGAGSGHRSFEHRVHLPAPVDADRIDAVMDHGLLTVTLPRAPGPGRRTIVIGGQHYDSSQIATGSTRAGSVDPAADRELHRPDTAAGTASRFTG